MKPKVFIGSSREAIEVADAVHENLQYDAEVTVWNQGVFEPSQLSVDSLLKKLEYMDFGVFVFAPDDTVLIRGNKHVATRDNVVLELGFYIGKLGRDRSFILLPRQNEGHRIPTDLVGVAPTNYESDRSDDNYVSATGPACRAILRQIKAIGPQSGDGRASSLTQQGDADGETRSPEAVEPALSDQAKTNPNEEGPERESRTVDECTSDMIAAFYHGDKERVEEDYKQAQDAESEPDKKLHIEALYLRLRYGQGDSSALDRLQDLVERAKEAPKFLPDIYQLLGSAYDLADDYQNAIQAYESAAAAASQSEEQRARYVAAVAHCLFESGGRDEALEKLMAEIEGVEDRAALSTLYGSIASLYETDNSELRAIALQKATEYKPNDTRLRFDAARSSDEGNLDALALMHYNILLRLKPDDASTLNNIGVVYGQLKLPIQQIASYKAAVKKGNTLAAANLAYQYLRKGFADEAKEVLNTAIKVEDAHSNVAEAKAAVDRQEEAESKTSKETLSAARQQYRFLLAFAEAYFSTPSGEPRFEGDWQLLDGVEVEITRDAGRLEMKWKRNGKDHVIAGRIRNRGVLITKYSRQDSYWWSNLGDNGYAYLSEDNQHLNLMTFKDGKHSFLELTLTQQQEGKP